LQERAIEVNYVAVVGDVGAASRKLFKDFAETSDSPLYACISRRIADDADLGSLLDHAPPQQRVPVLLFAAVHWMLLHEPWWPLARHYPNLAGDDVQPPGDEAFEAFRTFCLDRRAEIVDIVSSRRTQTNEIGRTALFVPSLAVLAADQGPLAHVEVGASAGLNQLIPHYDYAYEPGGTVSVGSPVVITCGTRGGPPIPIRHPAIARAGGVDVNPLDVRDPDEARWLEACVWPDHTERLARLKAAIAIARRVGVDVRRGDATSSVAALVDEVAGSGHAVITTSWVMSYLTATERKEFVDEVDRIGAGRDLTWLIAENPALCPELPGMPPPRAGVKQPSAVVQAKWRKGRRIATHVADAHPQGRWLHWRP
jgi:hypothetical protein